MIPVIDSEEYIEEYQTDDFEGFTEMFDEYGDVVLVYWSDGEFGLKTANRSAPSGEVVGFSNHTISMEELVDQILELE